MLGFFALTGIPTSVSSLSLPFLVSILIFVLFRQLKKWVFACRYFFGSNPLKLLIRKLRNKIKEMAFFKTLLCDSATHTEIVVLHILKI